MSRPANLSKALELECLSTHHSSVAIAAGSFAERVLHQNQNNNSKDDNSSPALNRRTGPHVAT